MRKFTKLPFLIVVLVNKFIFLCLTPKLTSVHTHKVLVIRSAVTDLSGDTGRSFKSITVKLTKAVRETLRERAGRTDPFPRPCHSPENLSEACDRLRTA